MNYNHDLLFDAYLPRIENLTNLNRRLYVTFSAVTGSGKTWLAKRIAKRFSGLYLAADDVRQSALELWPTISRHDLDQLIINFAPSIQDRLLKYPNKLHVVDTNIDKYAERVISKAEEINFPLFIIRLDNDKSALVERIKSREKNDFQDEKALLESLDDKLEAHAEFLHEFGQLITFSLLDSDNSSLEELYASIDLVLSESN